MEAQRKRVNAADDRISELPDDVLLNILSRVPTEESIRTSVLSNRWIHVWKELPHLNLDMRKIPVTRHLVDAGTSMTKIIRDHRGNLESCAITHHAFQCDVGMIETWIQALVHVKHVRHLSLVNAFGCVGRCSKANTTLDLPPDSFSHPNLESVVLSQYNVEALRGFKKCGNLRNLSLKSVFASIETFNAVFASCPSLEVLVLLIGCHERSGPLKIDNSKLKILALTCFNIDRIEVSAPSLDVLHIGGLQCNKENFVVANPNLQFNRNYFCTSRQFSLTSYYMSCPAQGEKCIVHEFMKNISVKCMNTFGSLSVKMDLNNTKEVNMLKEVLVAWPGDMVELEIMFKHNNAPREEGESSIGGKQNIFLGKTKPFPNATFRVCIVWLSNFSGSKEEFGLASCLVTQGTVKWALKIKPASWLSSRKVLEIEAGVANLKELSKGHKGLDISMVS